MTTPTLLEAAKALMTYDDSSCCLDTATTRGLIKTLRSAIARQTVDWELWAQRLADQLENHLDDEPCHLDHHGDCQTHNLTNPCQNVVGRQLLADYDADRAKGTPNAETL